MRWGLVDCDRIEAMLRVNPATDPANALRVTPFSAPLVLEVGNHSVAGEGAGISGHCYPEAWA